MAIFAPSSQAFRTIIDFTQRDCWHDTNGMIHKYVYTHTHIYIYYITSSQYTMYIYINSVITRYHKFIFVLIIDGIINYSIGISWSYGLRRTTMPHPHASARAFAAAREWISCAVRRSQLGWGCEPYWGPSQLVGTQARRSMYYIYIYFIHICLEYFT